jgi:hypothetical protein
MFNATQGAGDYFIYFSNESKPVQNLTFAAPLVCTSYQYGFSNGGFTNSLSTSQDFTFPPNNEPNAVSDNASFYQDCSVTGAQYTYDYSSWYSGCGNYGCSESESGGVAGNTCSLGSGGSCGLGVVALAEGTNSVLGYASGCPVRYWWGECYPSYTQYWGGCSRSLTVDYHYANATPLIPSMAQHSPYFSTPQRIYLRRGSQSEIVLSNHGAAAYDISLSSDYGAVNIASIGTGQAAVLQLSLPDAVGVYPISINVSYDGTESAVFNTAIFQYDLVSDGVSASASITDSGAISSAVASERYIFSSNSPVDLIPNLSSPGISAIACYEGEMPLATYFDALGFSFSAGVLNGTKDYVCQFSSSPALLSDEGPREQDSTIPSALDGDAFSQVRLRFSNPFQSALNISWSFSKYQDWNGERNGAMTLQPGDSSEVLVRLSKTGIIVSSSAISEITQDHSEQAYLLPTDAWLYVKGRKNITNTDTIPHLVTFSFDSEDVEPLNASTEVGAGAVAEIELKGRTPVNVSVSDCGQGSGFGSNCVLISISHSYPGNISNISFAYPVGNWQSYGLYSCKSDCSVQNTAAWQQANFSVENGYIRRSGDGLSRISYVISYTPYPQQTYPNIIIAGEGGGGEYVPQPKNITKQKTQAPLESIPPETVKEEQKPTVQESSDAVVPTTSAPENDVVPNNESQEEKNKSEVTGAAFDFDFFPVGVFSAVLLVIAIAYRRVSSSRPRPSWEQKQEESEEF